MENQKKIIDFKEGERLSVNLLLASMTKGTTNSGNPYLTLVLQDSSKSIEAKYWDVKPELEKILKVGKVYTFDMSIIKYSGNLQAKVTSVLPLSENEYNLDEFVAKTKMSETEIKNTISSCINEIENINIAKIVTTMLKKYDNDFYTYPAASKIHHEFMGGLSTHVTGMLKIAKALCDIYPSISRDYLYAGVILHDLGKIEELSSPVVTEYTTKGKLLGHISIVAANLQEVGTQLGLEDSEELLILRHMVLSHHGQLEFGSPVRPMTLEAEMLNFIDNIDARINIIDKALANVNEGEFTQRLFALDNRSFYKHK